MTKAETEPPEKITVSVTKTCIKKGIPTNRRECAVSQALKRMGYEDCWTGISSLYIGGARYDLPPEARKLVEMYDHNLHVEPLKFVAFREKPAPRPSRKARAGK